MKMIGKPLFVLNRDGESYKANLAGEIDLPDYLVPLGKLYGFKGLEVALEPVVAIPVELPVELPIEVEAQALKPNPMKVGKSKVKKGGSVKKTGKK